MESENSFKCGKCGGSGEKDSGTFRVEYARDMGYPPKPCPSCNKGNVQLAVECEMCEGKGHKKVHHFPRSLASPSHYVDQQCLDCTNGYRPLTDSEVRELLDDVIPDGANWYNLLITGRLRANFKGSQVVLTPKEDV